VTAFTAFLGSLTADHPRRVLLLYGARKENLFVYGDLVRARAAEVTSLAVELISEDTGRRLSADAAWPDIRKLDSPLFYLSGPPAMIVALRGQLEQHGVPALDIRTDEWE